MEPNKEKRKENWLSETKEENTGKKKKKRYQCWSITVETKRLEKKKNQKWQTKYFLTTKYPK